MFERCNKEQTNFWFGVASESKSPSLSHFPKSPVKFSVTVLHGLIEISSTSKRPNKFNIKTLAINDFMTGALLLATLGD